MNSGYYVNICDIVDKPVTQIDIQRFHTESDLSAYTRSELKFFPPPGKEGSKLINLLRRKINKPRVPSPPADMPDPKVGWRVL